MSKPKWYVQQPVEVEAFKLNGYGDFARAKEWVNENGGKAHQFVAADGRDCLAIFTIEGNIADVYDGWYLVRGIAGEFYPCRADIFEGTHSPAEEPETVEPLTGTGSYVVGRPDGRTALVGGAALKLTRQGTDTLWNDHGS